MVRAILGYTNEFKAKLGDLMKSSLKTKVKRGMGMLFSGRVLT